MPSWKTATGARFHNAKDLAVSIAIEAAELLEEFQWQDASEVAKTSADPDARERVRQELADVLIYCLSLSNALEIDISDAIRDKLVLSGHKYPAEAYAAGLVGRIWDWGKPEAGS